MSKSLQKSFQNNIDSFQKQIKHNKEVKYTNPKINLQIKYLNRHNEEYEVVKQPLPDHEYGIKYQDMIMNNLNPNVNTNLVYGQDTGEKVSLTKPFSQRIQEARDSINKMTQLVEKYEKEQQEAQQNLKSNTNNNNSSDSTAIANNSNTNQSGE